MGQRYRTSVVCAWLCLLSAVVGCGSREGDPSSSAGSTPPNLLLYVADTLRADALGAYGSGMAATPHLDAFATQSTLFEHAFSQSSWTRASVASILTGLHPAVHGAEDRHHALSVDVRLLSEILKDAGYATAMIVANPNVGSFFGFAQGFDDFVELYRRREPGRVRTTELVSTADVVTDRAIEWIRRAPRPFFLVLLTVDPHSPYEPPPGFDRFGRDIASAADGTRAWLGRRDLSPEDKRRIRALYHGEIAFNDAEFGRLMSFLAGEGLGETTVCIFTSDHGEEFWEHGRRGHGKTLHGEVLRVPLMVRYPPRVLAGQRLREAAQSVDILPTALDLLGMRSPAAVQGSSLFGPKTSDRAVFSALNLDGRHLSAVRTRDWKLTRNVANGETTLFDAAGNESRDLATEAPDRARTLGALLAAAARRDTALARGIRSGGTAPAVHAGDLDPETRRALEELGYLLP